MRNCRIDETSNSRHRNNRPPGFCAFVFREGIRCLGIFLISIFFIFCMPHVASAETQVIVGFDFEDSAKRSTANFVSEFYTADSGIVGNKDTTTIRLNTASFTAWVVGSGGTGTFAPNANGWHTATDSFWQISFSTAGYENLTLSSKQRGSDTGPRDFKVQWSLNGSDWIDVPSATITVANNFTTGILNNVSLPAGTENQNTVYLRWIRTSNIRVTGGTALVLSAGTNRIDDIIVSGEPLSKTITYDGNGATGGSVPQNQTKYTGVDLILRSNSGSLVKTGHTFAGWNTAADGTGTNYSEGGSFTQDADTTLYARWTQDRYSVTYDPGRKGTFAPQTTHNLFYGDDTPQPPTISGQPNWQFSGWVPDRLPNVINTVTYVAQWTYVLPQGPVVFYHVYGGGGNINGVYSHDFVVLSNIGDVPVNLDGWRIQYTSYNGTIWPSFGPLSGSISPGGYYVIKGFQGTNTPPQAELPYFHASFPLLMIDQKEYKMRLLNSASEVVDFIGSGAADDYLGSGAAPATADSGPERNQQSIIRNASIPNPYTGNNNTDYALQSPTDLTYLEYHIVSFDENTGDTPADPAYLIARHGGSPEFMPAQPGKAHHLFTGWNTASDGSGSVFDTSYSVTGNLRVYAQWKLLDIKNPPTGHNTHTALWALLAIFTLKGFIVLKRRHGILKGSDS